MKWLLILALVAVAAFLLGMALAEREGLAARVARRRRLARLVRAAAWEACHD